MKNDILDFEDIFDDIEALEDVVEVVTPGQVEARLRSAWSLWDALYQSNKNNAYITAEYRRFKQWIIPTLDAESSNWFATGTLNNLDKWDARYQAAYKKAGNVIDVVSPDLNSSYKLSGYNPFIVFGAGILGGLLLWFFLSQSSKRIVPRLLP